MPHPAVREVSPRKDIDRGDQFFPEDCDCDFRVLWVGHPHALPLLCPFCRHRSNGKSEQRCNRTLRLAAPKVKMYVIRHTVNSATSGTIKPLCPYLKLRGPIATAIDCQLDPIADST